MFGNKLVQMENWQLSQRRERVSQGIS